MSIDDQVDLGANDYSPEGKGSGFEQFLSKPVQRQYQPFGGQIQRKQSSVVQPQYVQPEIEEAPQSNYQDPFDEGLDVYDQTKKYHGQISQFARENERSAKHYEKLYDEFKENKFLPFYKQFDEFGDFESDDEYAASLDALYQNDLKSSQEEDSFFGGESESKKLAKARLGKYVGWNQPNGIRDQFLRLKSEKERRRVVADQAKQEEYKLFESLTSIPIPMREQMDQRLKTRSAKPRSKKATDQLLNGFQFEAPIADMNTGEIINLEKTDPRAKTPGFIESNTQRQQKRLEAAMRGDIDGFMSRRETVARDRQLRDRGILFSQSGLLDGRPVGLSRKDVDLLDIDEMKKLGIKEYKGVPIEQAFNDLGGEESLNMAKVMQAVRGSYSNYEDAQINWLTNGRKASDKAAMESSKAAFDKSIQLAAEFGLTDEVVEQTEKKGFFSRMSESIANAFRRGLKMNEMSEYSYDFFTNAADQSDFEKFIEISEELGEIPTSSAAKKFQQYKSKGFWDSVSNLLFDNAEAIPELFVESLSSFLPAYVRTGFKTIPGAAAVGGAAGLAGGPLAPVTVTGGAVSGATLAARANWGVASFVLEYSGMILEGMQELNIDYKNPKVFAAAWNNEITRDAIKEKALKKGLPIALLDSISGLMGSRVAAALHHGGNAIKGGKLIDGAAWKRSKQTYPKFTAFQRAGNAGLEVGTDAALGMGGEFLGQAWSKEPGEGWDHNAIVAEGIIGLGPGLLGGGYQVASTRNLDLTSTPFDYENVENTETGKTGIVNLAGFRNKFNSFNNAQAAASHVVNEGNFETAEEQENANSVLTDLMARLYELNPKAMTDLKIVVADRTPFSDKEMEGSFHEDGERTGTYAIYLNRNKIGKDPLGVFLHESGHLARKLMLSSEELMGLYESLGIDAQKDAFTQYTLKIPDQKYSQLNEAQKAQVDRAWNDKRMTPAIRAEEWFSYQWASLLAGRNIDSSVKTEYQNFLTKVLHPSMEKFMGGKTTGGTKEQQFRLNQKILQSMGYSTNGYSKQSTPRFGEYYNERPGMAKKFLNKEIALQQMGDDEALNFLMRKVMIIAQKEGKARAKQVAEAVNKMLDKKILPTDMSAYTKLELEEMATPIAEGRVAAEDAVKTAEVYEKLEGADAQEGVKQLLEIEETKPREGSKEKPKPILDEKGRVKPVKKAVESEVTPKVDLSEKEKLTNQVKATKTRKVAKIEKDVDRAQEQLEARVIPVQYLMPGAEIIEKGDKFELKIRQPGTRKPRAPRLFDTKAEAEKAQKEFFTQELKNLKDISKKVSDIQKLAMDETAFNKKSTEVKKKLLEELESEGSAVSERDISHSQIIAEMMGLNSLMDGAIFSSALAAFDLADVSSGKAPDGQRVVEAFAKYEQQVAFAVGSIDTRIAELETRKEFLNLEKQRLNGGITQKAFDQKVKALGSAQDKKGSLPPGKWVVVFRGPQGNWKKWKDGKWVNAPKLDDNKFVRKRLDPKVYGYVKADKEAASKALNEKQRNFISFWREPDNQSKTPAKKTAPKPKPKAEAPKAKADTKAIDAEISEIDKKLTMLREYRDAIEPEKATIDWMDVPHLNYHKFIDPDGDTNAFPTKKNGKRVKKNFERYTLGQLASLDRKSDIWMVYGRPGRETIEKLDGLSDSQAYLFKYTNWRLNSPEPEAKAEGQKPNVEVDPGPMIDPTSSSEKTFERNGEQVRLEIDVNGRAVLYGADNRALNIIKNDLDALVLEKFGKTAKDIAKDLKGVPTKPKFMDPISEKEWSSFTKTGKVSNERLKDIVKKYTQGVKTTPEEVQIFTDMHEDRDKLLAQLQKDPTSLGSGIDQSFNPFAYGRKMTDKLDWFGNKTVKEYTEMLDAVRASAALPETIGGRRYKEGDRIFMQSENGTSVAAMMLFRLKEQDKADGINNRNITSGELSRLTLSEMSVYELATGRSLEILDDRDIRGSKQQRYHQLIERRAHEMTKDIAEYEKLIKDMEEGSEQRAGAERSVTRLRQQLKALFFDYDEPGSFQGEETGGFFPQLHGGKQWSQSLTEYFFYQEKAEAVKKIIGIWAEDIASEQGPGVGRTKKETLSKDPAWSSSVEAWNKLEPAKKAALRNNLYSVVRELKKDESITEEDILKAKEEFEKLQKEAQKSYEEQYEAKTAEETAQAAKEWGTSVTSPDDYEFFAQGEKATSTVKAGNGHGAFARGSADEGVDVLSLFAKGRADKFDPERVTFGTGSGSEQANPDLARDLERRLDEAIVKKSFEVMQDEKYQDIPLFEITRADGQKLKVKRVKGLWKKANGHVIDQETEKIAREDFIKNKPELINEIRNVMVAQDSMGTVGVSSGNSVSPAQFVRYLLDNIGKKKGKAGLKQALLALQYTPSSEVDNGMLKQLPGGPAGGILPYVWNDFMLEVYKLLKIEKDFEFVPAPDPKKSGWKNQSEEIERTITENGKTRRISEPNTLWKNGYPDVDAMVKQVQPVIQAVYDAGRVMLAVGRGFDEEESSKNSLNASNVLQQDPTIHTSSFESFIKSDAPEGSMDNQETDSVVNKDQAKTVQVEEEETASDEDLKKLGDDDLIPQSFSTQNDPISQKLEGTETMRKLFELKKGGKELTLNKVLKEFRTDERLWNAFGMPMPPQKDYLVYKWAKALKKHPNYPKFKARVLGSDTQALGSSFSPSTKNKVLKLLAPRNLNRLFVENGLEDEMSDDGNYYDSKGDIIPLETPSSLRNLLNLCLSTMSGTIEKAKNLGLKARPGHIIAKNPAIEDTYIDHAVALVTIDGVEYVVDDPQTNFLKGGVTVPTPEEIAWEAGMIDLIEEKFDEMVAEDEYLSNALTAKELKKRRKEYLDKNWPQERGGVQLKDKFEPYLIPLTAKALKKEYGKEAMNIPGFWQPMNVSFVEVPRLVKGDGPLKESTYGITSLGSSYALSSGIPTDYMQSSVLLTKMANKVGFDDDGRDQLKEFWEKKKAMFKSGDLVSSFIDQSRAGTKFISDALKDMGVTDQKLLDSLDVRGLWHLYYGKTDEQIKTANLRYFEPIRDALNDHGITLEQFGEYLIARVAPSRNKHLKSLYVELMNDAKDEDTKNEIKEMLERRGESLSGVSTEVAIQVVQKMEADEAFMNFLKDEREPLQKFYDMNRESIDIRATSQLIQKTEALDEVTAMVQASSSFNWKKDGGSKIMYMRNGKEDNYSYAPMQGFEGAQETQKLYDNEEAYEVLGKSSSASGRAWDQPKNKFLFKGAFGRREDTLGPNPEMVFAVSQDQYFQSGIRGAKNEVSNSFGAAFELFRAVAYHNSKEVSGLPLVELPDQIKDIIEKDPSVIESTREMFEGKDAIFEKDFNPIQTKKDYKISTKAITVDGEEVEGFKMVTREINTEFQNDTHVFVYRKNGVPQYIKFRKNLAGSRVARSVKNLRYEALPTFLKGVNSVTRFMASMFTSKNPAFMIPNFIRDLGTMFIHLTEDDKKQFVKAAFNPKRLGGFIKHITLAERKNFKGDIIELDPGELTSEEYAKKLIKDGDYAKVYQLAKASGAKVGYFRHKSIPELIDEMKADTGKSRKGARKKWNSFVNYLDTVNTALENSIRMSAFASAIEAGFTTHQAAVISRNVTVDFNQKGELTQTMGALFVFFGASMNSMHRMMSTFKKRTPQERKKLIIGIAGASFALNIFNRLMDDDDEEPLPDYDTISEFRRDTMAIVGDPRDKNTGYFGVPLPLGYNMFWTLGQTAGDVFAKYVMGRGGAGAVDFLTRNLNATLNGFNPIGGSTLATAMIPTVGKPMAELWANQNFMGMPIRNEDRPYEAVKPAHMMDPKRTQEHWTALSEGLNSLLGGSDQVKGSVGGMLGSQPLKGLEGTDLKFDISGSQMEHLLLGYAGGPGQIINMMFGSLVFPAFSEEKDYGTYDPNKMPIANRFYRSSTHGSRVKNLYYQVREANKIAERATKAAKIAGPKQFAEANRNMRDLLALSGNIKYTDAFKKKIATHKAKVESSKSLTQDQKLQRIAQLEQKEHAAFVKVIKKAQSLGIS